MPGVPGSHRSFLPRVSPHAIRRRSSSCRVLDRTHGCCCHLSTWTSSRAGGIVLSRALGGARKSGYGGVHTDEVAVLEVEAVELVAGLLGVHHVLIDDECSALGVVRNALADLATSQMSASVKLWSAGDSCDVGRERLHTEQGRTCRTGRRALPGIRCSWERSQHGDGVGSIWRQGETYLRFFTKRALCRYRVSRQVMYSFVARRMRHAVQRGGLPVDFWGKLSGPTHSLASRSGLSCGLCVGDCGTPKSEVVNGGGSGGEAFAYVDARQTPSAAK